MRLEDVGIDIPRERERRVAHVSRYVLKWDSVLEENRSERMPNRMGIDRTYPGLLGEFRDEFGDVVGMDGSPD